MFNNIGGKIKVLATVICIIGFVASTIGGIVFLVAADDLLYLPAGLLIIIFGGLFSWISSFTLYAFGQIAESSEFSTEYNYAAAKNSEIMLESLEEISDKLDKLVKANNNE